MLIVVSLFLAAGLDPAVRFFERRGHAALVRRPDRDRRRARRAGALPGRDRAGHHRPGAARSPTTRRTGSTSSSATGRSSGSTTSTTSSARSRTTSPPATSPAPSSAARSGVGLAVLGALFNGFIVTVLTLYFLASLQTTKSALYRLAPASRRDRVSRLGDRILRSVGGYVSGAFIVAMCAGISSLVFLFVVGLERVRRGAGVRGRPARRDPDDRRHDRRGHRLRDRLRRPTGRSALACAIFYIVYQQLENYVIYPRVMSKSVDLPGALTVIAALVGAALLRRGRRAAGDPDRRRDPDADPRSRGSGGRTRARRPRLAGQLRRAVSTAVVRSPSLTTTTPARISTPPSHLHRRAAARRAAATPRATPTSTSTSATNDASREPSRRTAAMPVT